MLRLYSLSFIACLTLALIFPSLKASSNNLRVLIDTDIGLGKLYKLEKEIPADIDDAYAIVNALRSSELHVAGITTVFGNTQLDSANQSVQTILKLSHNGEIPWMPGAAKAGKEKEPCHFGASRAADFIARKLKDSPAHLLAIGPLTNIACLLATHREVKPKIKEILVVMGQSIDTTFSINNISVQDLNFESDMSAVNTILKSKVPMSFFPFELTKKVLINRNRIVQMKSKDPLIDYFRKSSFDFITHWKSIFREDGFHPWDSAPVAYLKNPDWFRCEKRTMILDHKNGNEKLIAKTNNNHYTPWNFCYDFTTKGAKNSFEEDVLNKITQKPDQS
ncbi:MAG: nucleoside hydrolase [Oligoflexales bacterium]